MDHAASRAPGLDRVVRRVARRILPLLFVGYVVNHVDRINVAFAKGQISDALALSDTAFGLGAGMFFVGYLVFEVPSNLMLARLGARRWLAAIMAGWGCLTVLQGFVETPTQFYATRFLIGAAEAGFLPGSILYLTWWIPDSHRGGVLARFMSAAPISGALAGPFCGFVLDSMHGVAALDGWQWLMFTTGVPAIIVALGIALALPEHPTKARWLSGPERDALPGSQGDAAPATAAAVRDALRSRTTWNGALIYFAVLLGAYGTAFWLPTAFADAGVESNTRVGVLVGLAHVIGIAAMFFIGRSSDRWRDRRWHLSACLAIAAAGYLLLAGSLHSVAAIFVASSLIGVGILAAIPISWAAVTQALPATAAAAGIAIVSSFGNLAGLVAPVAMGRSSDSGALPTGLVAIAVVLALGAGWVIATVRAPGRGAAVPMHG